MFASTKPLKFYTDIKTDVREMTSLHKTSLQVLLLLSVALLFVGGLGVGWLCFQLHELDSSLLSKESFDSTTIIIYIAPMTSHGTTLIFGVLLTLTTFFRPRVFSTTAGLFIIAGLLSLHIEVIISMFITSYLRTLFYEILVPSGCTVILTFLQGLLAMWILTRYQKWPVIQNVTLSSAALTFCLIGRIGAAAALLTFVNDLATMFYFFDVLMSSIIIMCGLLFSIETFLSFTFGYIHLAFEAWSGIALSVSYLLLGVRLGVATGWIPWLIIANCIIHLVVWMLISRFQKSQLNTRNEDTLQIPSVFHNVTLHCNLTTMILSMLSANLLGIIVLHYSQDLTVNVYILLCGNFATFCRSSSTCILLLFRDSDEHITPCCTGILFLIESLLTLYGSITSFYSTAGLMFTASIINFPIIILLMNMVVSDKMTSSALSTGIKLLKKYKERSEYSSGYDFNWEKELLTENDEYSEEMRDASYNEDPQASKNTSHLENQDLTPNHSSGK